MWSWSNRNINHYYSVVTGTTTSDMANPRLDDDSEQVSHRRVDGWLTAGHLGCLDQRAGSSIHVEIEDPGIPVFGRGWPLLCNAIIVQNSSEDPFRPPHDDI